MDSSPQFHPEPPIQGGGGLSSNPNGLLWADGRYHMFWQCNPLGTAWGNMYWGHASSPDLIHWTEMKRAVRSGPANGTPDSLRHPSMAAGACFSGGGNVDINNTAGWKTGDNDTVFLLVSDMSRGQSIAYSTDGGENFSQGIECFYNYAVTPAVRITPDVQYVVPALRLAEPSLIAGVRALVSF